MKRNEYRKSEDGEQKGAGEGVGIKLDLFDEEPWTLDKLSLVALCQTAGSLGRDRDHRQVRKG